MKRVEKGSSTSLQGKITLKRGPDKDAAEGEMI